MEGGEWRADGAAEGGWRGEGRPCTIQTTIFFFLYSAKIGGLFTSEIIYPKRSKPKVSSLRLTEAATIL